MSAREGTPQDDPWKPVLSEDGVRYCSRRCGFGCTKAAHDLAVEKAEALAKRMGEGWHPRVWENGDWYYEVRKGVAVVMPTGQGRMHVAFINTSPQFIAHSTDPVEALRKAFGEAEQDLEQRVRQMAVLRGQMRDLIKR